MSPQEGPTVSMISLVLVDPEGHAIEKSSRLD